MSKGKIVAHIGAGQYTVEVERLTQAIVDQLADKQAALTDIETNQIPAAETEIATLNGQQQEAETALNAAIDARSNCVQLNGVEGCTAESNAVDTALKAKLGINGQLGIKQGILAGLKATRIRLIKEIALLQSAPAQKENISAWCADCLDAPVGAELTGEWLGHGNQIPVGTTVSIADVYSSAAAGGRYSVIWPNFSDQGGYNAGRDGYEMPALNMAAGQLVHCATLLAPAEVWRPLYRAATITGMVGDKSADISFEDYQDNPFHGYSTSISINKQLGPSASAVNIDYMESQYPPMDAGDQVLVHFNGRGMSPEIIGFITNPKPLLTAQLNYYTTGALTLTGEPQQEVEKGEDGTPVFINGDFLKWDDGSFDNPRQDTNVLEDISVTAEEFTWPPRLLVTVNLQGPAFQDTIDSISYYFDQTLKFDDGTNFTSTATSGAFGSATEWDFSSACVISENIDVTISPGQYVDRCNVVLLAFAYDGTPGPISGGDGIFSWGLVCQEYPEVYSGHPSPSDGLRYGGPAALLLSDADQVATVSGLSGYNDETFSVVSDGYELYTDRNWFPQQLWRNESNYSATYNMFCSGAPGNSIDTATGTVTRTAYDIEYVMDTLFNIPTTLTISNQSGTTSRTYSMVGSIDLQAEWGYSNSGVVREYVLDPE